MRQLFTLFVFAFLGQISAQTGCPDCQVSLPDTLAGDALYLDSLADGQAGATYNETLSFRLPMTTTPVVEAGSDVPAGLNITRIRIDNVVGVPAGLSWELSNDDFMVQDSTDGCVRICGTPLIAGDYVIEVQLRAFLGPLSSPSSVLVPLRIEPEVVDNDGFSILNASGCGEVTVEFVNNNPSEGEEGFSYFWDFGQGDDTLDEDPDPLTYDQPGTYVISYQAVVDTSAYILTNVTVLDTDCTDLFGTRPDLKINVFDPDGEILYTAPIVEDAFTPLDFITFIELGEGNYSVQVVDDDSGLGGADDDCGTVTFNRESSGVFNVGGLSLSIDIFHPVDTIEATDTVRVFEQPEVPIVDSSDDFVCENDSILLTVMNFDSNLIWTRNGELLLETGNQLTVVDSGAYVAAFQTEQGCISYSDTFFVNLFPAPPMITLVRTEGGLVATQDGVDVPPGTDFMWLLDGLPFEEDRLFFCPSINGRYTLLVFDGVTGCETRNEIVVSDVGDFVCDTPVEELLPTAGWLLYPNPSQGLVYLQMPESSGTRWDLTLIDALGRMIWQSRIDHAPVDTSLELDWTGLPAGSYRLLARSEAGLVVLPVLRR